MVSSARYDDAIALIDAEHTQDPEKDPSGEPRELVYARRMSAWLKKLAPGASEELRLATRSQHLRRWSIARSAYPSDKVGYLRWRKESANAHAALAGELLQQAGYETSAVKRVQSLIKKERIKHDLEAQLLEDCACLVFLEYEFAGFAAKHTEAKLIDILRKSWSKMSPAGHHAALGLDLPLPLRRVIEKAVSG